MVPSSSSLLVTVAALQGVRAWGSLGHATVAYIAQNYVTAETAAWCVSCTFLLSIFSFTDLVVEMQGARLAQ